MDYKEFLQKNISPWVKEPTEFSDIVLSTRVRLARNIKGMPFPTAKAPKGEEVLNKMSKIFLEKAVLESEKLKVVKMDDLTDNDKMMLVEKHLISPHLASTSNTGACFINDNEKISIMINEEDHLRIQTLFPGLALKQALEKAFFIDDLIEKQATYAFDTNLGFLTSCPSNVGTGLRASVMVHLPILTVSNHLEVMLESIGKMGLVVRGVYGEGSHSVGNIYQISNQITNGKSEITIIRELQTIVEQIIFHERHSRQTFLDVAKVQLEDRVLRSLGVLRHARLLSLNEAAQRLSDVRLGIDIGVIKNLSSEVFAELMIAIQPAFLQKMEQKQLSTEEEQELRATLIRECIN